MSPSVREIYCPGRRAAPGLYRLRLRIRRPAAGDYLSEPDPRLAALDSESGRDPPRQLYGRTRGRIPGPLRDSGADHQGARASRRRFGGASAGCGSRRGHPAHGGCDGDHQAPVSELVTEFIAVTLSPADRECFAAVQITLPLEDPEGVVEGHALPGTTRNATSSSPEMR